MLMKIVINFDEMLRSDLEFVQNKAPKVTESDLTPASWEKERWTFRENDGTMINITLY